VPCNACACHTRHARGGGACGGGGGGGRCCACRPPTQAAALARRASRNLGRTYGSSADGPYGASIERLGSQVGVVAWAAAALLFQAMQGAVQPGQAGAFCQRRPRHNLRL
jgi:hypothetical protein